MNNMGCASEGCANTRCASVTLDEAVDLMRQSRAVIYPTETFFALGSRALDPAASALVFRAKNRSNVRPLPLIIGNLDQLDLVARVPGYAERLFAAFWPGPLSVILPAPLRVPDILTGGTGCVAVRLSSHPVACELALRLGEPITSSSANISGDESVVRVAELTPDLVGNVDGILDMPPTPSGGLPSTLVKFVDAQTLQVLRAGAVSMDQLRAQGFDVVE